MPTPADILATGVKEAFKVLYTPQQIVQALQSQCSPALKIPKAVPSGGKEYPMPMLESTGGNVMGDYTVSSTHAASYQAAVKTPAIPPAQLFSTFILNPYEAEASLKKDGAFESIGIVRMAAAIDMMRRGLGACFYGMGYHEIGQVVADAAIGQPVITVTPETENKIDLGSPINIYASDDIEAAVAAAVVTGSPYYVDSITERSDGNYDVTFTANLSANVTAGYWMFINGGLTAAGKGYVPNGLASIIPYYASRTGASWNTYIATSFYGVDRSTYTTRNAGWFVKKAVDESLTDLFVRALQKAKRAKNYNPKILINDRDYLELLADANAKLTAYSEVRGVKTRTNNFSLGGKVFEVVFDDLNTDAIIPDPACPKGVAWIVDGDTWIMPALTNVMNAIDGIDRKEPNEAINGANEPSKSYQMLMDKWITTAPVKTVSGYGVEVSLNAYLNFGCVAPSRNGVVMLS